MQGERGRGTPRSQAAKPPPVNQRYFLARASLRPRPSPSSLPLCFPPHIFPFPQNLNKIPHPKTHEARAASHPPLLARSLPSWSRCRRRRPPAWGGPALGPGTPSPRSLLHAAGVGIRGTSPSRPPRRRRPRLPAAGAGSA